MAREILMLSIKKGEAWAYDDITGTALPPHLVKEAKKPRGGVHPEDGSVHQGP